MKFSIIVAQSLFLTAACLVTAGLQAAEETAPIDFARDVMPILAAHCVDCHGSDQHESGLRLDSARWAHRGGDRGLTIVPGKSGKSVLFQAILGRADVTAMPVDADRLSTEQIAMIRRWIDEGAVIPDDEPEISTSVESDHWAFQPVRRPVAPAVSRTDWIRNPIDRFVLARLEQEGIDPSDEADRVTLIRRLSLDLLGLLPTIDEVEQYLADDKPGAYERLVDRMLASPHYGERWGRHWLDIARYADSNGFTIDGPRSIWK